MKYFGKQLKGRPVLFYIFLLFMGGLTLYIISLFVYLKIVGVYAVATIIGGIPTSEGIDYKYEFYYLGETYTGGFTSLQRLRFGDKFFVSFSKKNPSQSLLKYYSSVPDCLKDSVFSFWETVPECSANTKSK